MLSWPGASTHGGPPARSRIGGRRAAPPRAEGSLLGRITLKRSWLIVLMLLIVALAVVPAIAGCGGDDATTTTTAAAAGDPVAAADEAIAAITKSDAIETPPTLEAGKL